MSDHKKQAAQEAFRFVAPGQIIGLGDGTTILHLTDLIAADKNLANSVTFTSSSAKTTDRIKAYGLAIKPSSDLTAIDVYFDGCDQFDRELNALKSGAGIHAIEKILASMSAEFILVGDSSKFSEQITTQYPLVVEILPPALNAVKTTLQVAFSGADQKLRQKNGESNAMVNDRGNYLLEIKFNEFPELSFLNTFIKMLPGVVDHSLFYQLATKAVVAGPNGVEIIYPDLTGLEH